MAKYSDITIVRALTALRNGELYKDVSRRFVVPESTLWSWNNNRVDLSKEIRDAVEKECGKAEVKPVMLSLPKLSRPLSLSAVVSRMRDLADEQPDSVWKNSEKAYDTFRRMFISNVLLWGGQPIFGLISDGASFMGIRDGTSWVNVYARSRIFSEMVGGRMDSKILSDIASGFGPITSGEPQAIDTILRKENKPFLIGMSISYVLDDWTPNSDKLYIPKQKRIYAYSPYYSDKATNSFVCGTERVEVPKYSMITAEDLSSLHLSF